MYVTILFVLTIFGVVPYSMWVVVRRKGWDWVTMQPPELAIHAPIYRYWEGRRKKLIAIARLRRDRIRRMADLWELKHWTRTNVANYLRQYDTRTDALSEMTDEAIRRFDLEGWRREEVKEVVKEVVYSTEGIG